MKVRLHISKVAPISIMHEVELRSAVVTGEAALVQMQEEMAAAPSSWTSHVPHSSVQPGMFLTRCDGERGVLDMGLQTASCPCNQELTEDLPT